MKKLSHPFGFLTMLFVLGGQAQAAVISITDWAGVPGAVDNVFTAGSTTFSVTTPSNGNPGSNLRIASTILGSTGRIDRFVAFNGATYNPGTQGAVTSFDISIDQLAESTPTGGHGWGIGFKQGSNLQLLNMFSLFSPTNQLSYTNYAGTGFDGSSLVNFFSSGAIDFSASGGAIQLGLYIFSGNGGAPSRSDQTRYDNFSLTFNTAAAVPESSTYVLFLTGFLGLGFIQRKRGKAKGAKRGHS